MEKRKNLWTVMLSGGDGERLRPFVQRPFGRDRAKQYCTFIEHRTMFEHTAYRAKMLAPAHHSAAVVAKSHVERGWVGPEHLGQRHFPRTIALLEQAANAFDTDTEDEALQRAYREMPSWNLSKDLLSQCHENLAVMELDGVQWSDWGKPERILETISRMRRANDRMWSAEVLNLSGAEPPKWKRAAPIEEANYVAH